eukprot:COSAG01_NODE_7595_length_3133_cov_31.926170_1_plen_222_part_00
MVRGATADPFFVASFSMAFVPAMKRQKGQEPAVQGGSDQEPAGHGRDDQELGVKWPQEHPPATATLVSWALLLFDWLLPGIPAEPVEESVEVVAVESEGEESVAVESEGESEEKEKEKALFAATEAKFSALAKVLQSGGVTVIECSVCCYHHIATRCNTPHTHTHAPDPLACLHTALGCTNRPLCVGLQDQQASGVACDSACATCTNHHHHTPSSSHTVIT